MLNLKPDFIAHGPVHALALTKLREAGIRGLILDLDSTIMASRSGRLTSEVEAWLAELRAAELQAIVVTNNDNLVYLRGVIGVLEEHGIELLHSARKPRRRKLKEAATKLGLPPERICLVGDRVLTDVWGGVRFGCKTALVRPLVNRSEHPLIRTLRSLEYLFLHPSCR